MQKNIALFEREDTYTLGLNIVEFEQLEEIILGSQGKFERRFNQYGNQGRRGKENRELYSEITNKIQHLKNLMKNSIYNPYLDKGHMHMKNLVNKSCREEIRLNKYSNADIMLATTALTRANNDKKTHVLTPDTDIANIIYASLINIDTANLNGFQHPYKLNDNIHIFNTYNDRMRLDTILECA